MAKTGSFEAIKGTTEKNHRTVRIAAPKFCLSKRKVLRKHEGATMLQICISQIASKNRRDWFSWQKIKSLIDERFWNRFVKNHFLPAHTCQKYKNCARSLVESYLYSSETRTQIIESSIKLSSFILPLVSSIRFKFWYWSFLKMVWSMFPSLILQDLLQKSPFAYRNWKKT